MGHVEFAEHCKPDRRFKCSKLVCEYEMMLKRKKVFKPWTVFSNIRQATEDTLKTHRPTHLKDLDCLKMHSGPWSIQHYWLIYLN